MDLSPIGQAAVTAAASVVTALAALTIPLLPRLARWLLVSINGADATLIRAAIENAAEAALRQVRDGHPMHAAIGGMSDYVRANLPDTLRRVGVSAATLDTMCRAALARVMRERDRDRP